MLAPVLTLIGALLQSKPSALYGGRAEELVKSCQQVKLVNTTQQADDYSVGNCLGYISGVIDGGTQASKDKPNDAFAVCVPTAATMRELALVIVKYGDDHPERLHWLAVRFVVQALAQSYPCTETGGLAK